RPVVGAAAHIGRRAARAHASQSRAARRPDHLLGSADVHAVVVLLAEDLARQPLLHDDARRVLDDVDLHDDSLRIGVVERAVNQWRVKRGGGGERTKGGRGIILKISGWAGSGRPKPTPALNSHAGPKSMLITGNSCCAPWCHG